MKLILRLFLVCFPLVSAAQEKVLKLAVVSLTHTHVHGVFQSEKRGEFEIVGIVEPDKALVKKYADQYHFSPDKVFDTMSEMIAATKPEAVSAFGTIYDHLSVVETCAPQGIHVMVEKPLAVSLDHARKMETLAKKHGIQLLTNYETTWYPTNHKARELLQNGQIGAVKKVVVRDGHRGPAKLNISHEFLDWLIDPKLNGGGAITDFGCYGVNLMTWLMQGQKPDKVMAITQQLQAENNPKVDDDATLILTYKNANAVIQPSWDWPIGRKDMEIYGLTGALFADNRNQLRLRMAQGYDGFEETVFNLDERKPPFDDPFALFAAVIQGKTILEPYDLSSLENNMVVMEILEAARQSAAKGKVMKLR